MRIHLTLIPRQMRWMTHIPRQNIVSYLSSWQDLPGQAEVDEFDYPTLAVVKHHVLRLEQDIYF